MDQEYVEWILESVMGELLPEYHCPQAENLFEEGKECERLYANAIEAYWRLCDRLGVEEDPDGEIMIDSLLAIVRNVGCQMFQYGATLEKK